MNILAFDPGKDNFGWAIVGLKKSSYRQHDRITINKKSYYVISGCLKNLISYERQRVVGLEAFTDEVKDLLWQTCPSHVVYERFIPRPGMGVGGGGEAANVMVGAMLYAALNQGVDVYPVTASQWKRWAKEISCKDLTISTGAVPLMHRKKGRKAPGRTPHEQDAIGMAVWFHQTDHLEQLKHVKPRKKVQNRRKKG